MKKLSPSREGGFSRRSFLKRSAAAGAGALLAPTFITQSAWAKAKVLKVGHIEAPNSATHQSYLKFQKLVAERTGGSIDVKVFPAGQLGGLRDLFEGIRFGSVEMTSSGPDYISNLVPMVVCASLYYLWHSEDHARKVLTGPNGSIFDKYLIKQAQLRAVAWGNLGFRSVFNTKRAIKTPADLAGMKIRVPEAKLHMVPMKALGALPTPIPYAEVYTSLQTNIVDAAEAVPAVVVQQKFNEVSKYYSLTNHLFNPLMVVIGEKFYQSLSAKEKEAVVESAREAWRAEWDVAAKDNLAAIDKIQAGGVPVNAVDMAPFIKIVEPTWKELIDPLGKEGWDIVNKFRDAA